MNKWLLFGPINYTLKFIPAENNDILLGVQGGWTERPKEDMG